MHAVVNWWKIFFFFFEEVCKIASAIILVPGSVGPMTIAMLLSNTLSSAKTVHNFKRQFLILCWCLMIIC